MTETETATRQKVKCRQCDSTAYVCHHPHAGDDEPGTVAIHCDRVMTHNTFGVDPETLTTGLYVPIMVRTFAAFGTCTSSTESGGRAYPWETAVAVQVGRMHGDPDRANTIYTVVPVEDYEALTGKVARR
jgi:hypothetical protein